ncbi:hypothetical protein FF1_037954 [Malus domestica]
MQEMDGFVAAHPKRVVHRKTTHTHGAAPTNQNMEGFKFWEGSDLGVLDGGIEPIHPSCSGAGIPPPPTKWKGSIAISSFAAIQKGIFVSCAVGNSGPFNGTISNEAPWILTVGASTIDRHIVATTKLGNEEVFDGDLSLSQEISLQH